MASTAPGAASTPVLQRHNLPKSLTSFIGREAELADVMRLLSSTRLLTLVGVGGIGKTRLALEVAQSTADEYPDGVSLVELAPLADEARVPDVTADALRVRLQPDLPAIQALATAIAGRAMLIVLDNCEHLVDACARLADGLLRACSGLRILTTSRQSLGVPGEVVWQVASLPLPDPGAVAEADAVLRSAAVRLFAERAAASAPGFSVTDRTATTVTEICRRLDGIPLAIELAASRVRLLGVEQIEERLDDRLRLLGDGGRTRPHRQQTVRATFDWSYSLLSSSERIVLRRLSVFAGGFTLEAAEGVCGDRIGGDDVFSALSGLVDKSLVQVEGDHRRTRYRLLETVRQYAAEQLAAAFETAEIATRHRDWYVAWTERVVPELTRRDQVVWFQRLAAELDNCRAADAWSRAHPDDGGPALRLAGALGRYWWVAAPGSEGREWLEYALTHGPSVPSVALARALTWCGQLECHHGDGELGRGHLEQAVSVAREVGDGALLSLTLRQLALYARDQSSAPEVLMEAARVARLAGARRELSLALGYLGAVHEQLGRVDRAETLYTEALDHARVSEDAFALIDVLDRLGTLAASRGKYAEATTLLNECLTHSQSINYGMSVSLAHRRLAQLALLQADLSVAQAHARASLREARTLGRGALVLWPLQLAATLAVHLGDHARGVRALAAVAAWRERHELTQDRTLWTRVLPDNEAEAALRQAHEVLGNSAFTAAWEAGCALPLEAAADEVLAPASGGPPEPASVALRPPPQPNVPDDITAREREVAELVGLGYTNRQIAERLVITEGTAKVHVGRVLAKLEFHTRAQLAAWVVQQGLIETPHKPR
jgi:non-specific serine/threonine protein kinase